MYDELGEDGKRAHTVTAIAKAREPSAGRTFCRRRGHSHRPRQEQRVVTSTPVTGPRCSLQHHLRQLLEQPVRPPQLITAGAGLTHQLGHRGGLLLFQSGPARPPVGRGTPRPRPLLYRIIRGACSYHLRSCQEVSCSNTPAPANPGLSGDGVSWRDRNTETATVPARPGPGFLLTTMASPPLITGGSITPGPTLHKREATTTSRLLPQCSLRDS